MNDKFYSSMYGVNKTAPKEVIPDEREKRAVKVLGGMKVHNSHIKRVQIGEDLVDVPKIEYVQLLESQLRETRTSLRDALARIYRLQTAHNKMLGEVRDLRRDVNAKVDLR